MMSLSRISLSLVTSLIVLPQVASAKLCYKNETSFGNLAVEYYSEKVGGDLLFWRCTTLLNEGEDAREGALSEKCKIIAAGTAKDIQENIELANRIARLQPLRKAVSIGNGVVSGSLAGAAMTGASALVVTGIGSISGALSGAPLEERQKRAAIGAGIGTVVAAPLGVATLASSIYVANRISDGRMKIVGMAENIRGVALIPSLFEDKNSKCTFDPKIKEIDSSMVEQGLLEASLDRSFADRRLGVAGVFLQAVTEQLGISGTAFVGPVMLPLIDSATGNLPGIKGQINQSLDPKKLQPAEMPQGVVDANRSSASADSQ